jgi:hypothetical protein
MPFVQSECNGAGASDLPHRFLLWGETKLPSRMVVNPMLELRSGFPYQSLDLYQNFVAKEAASTWRLPFYASVDLRVSRPFRLTDKYTLLPSIGATNVTNHFDALAVHTTTMLMPCMARHLLIMTASAFRLGRTILRAA